MSNETQHPMDEQLRRHAKARREQAGGPFAPHPADVRRWQEEAARLYAPGRRTAAVGWLDWLGQWWPRFGLAGAILVVLGVMVYSLWMDHEGGTADHQMMAKSSPNPSGTVARTEGPAAPLAVESIAPTAVAPPESSVKTVSDTVRTTAPFLDKANQVVASRRAVTSEPAVMRDDTPTARSADAEQAPPSPKPMVAMRGAPAPARTTPADVGSVAAPAAAPPTPLAMRSATVAPAMAPPNPVEGTVPLAATVPASAPAKQAPMQGLAYYFFSQSGNMQADAKLATIDKTGNAAPMPPGAAIAGAASQVTRQRVDTQAEGAKDGFGGALTALAAPTATRQRYGIVSTSTPPQILATFDVEIGNDRIRIIDSDGSVYDGAWIAAETVKMESVMENARSAPGRGVAMRGAGGAVGGGGPTGNNTGRRSFGAPPVAQESLAPAAPSLRGQTNPSQSFQAAGLNQSLKRTITFQGRFVENANLQVKTSNAAMPVATRQLEGTLRIADGPVRLLQAVPLEK